MGHARDPLLDFSTVLSHRMAHVRDPLSGFYHGVEPLDGTYSGPTFWISPWRRAIGWDMFGTHFGIYQGVDPLDGTCSGTTSGFYYVADPLYGTCSGPASGFYHDVAPLEGTWSGHTSRFYYGVEPLGGTCSGPVSGFLPRCGAIGWDRFEALAGAHATFATMSCS